MTMKRIVLTATDYGLAFGIDRSIRELVAANRLSAVGCLVVSDLWSREFLPLRECVDRAGGRTAVGLSVVLSGDFEPVTAQARRIFNGKFPSTGFYARRGLFGLLPDEILIGEIQGQLDRFEEVYGARPDFVTLHDALDNRPGVAKLLTSALSEQIALGVTVILREPQRWRNRRLARRITKLGGSSNPGGVTVSKTTDQEALHRVFWSGFDFKPDNTCVWCKPGTADDRLRRLETEDEIEVREAQLTYLKSHRFLLALTEKDLFLF